MTGWEISVGLYPGFLLGISSHVENESTDHVLYMPFVELCLTIYYED
jgi:hypothetical protein